MMVGIALACSLELTGAYRTADCCGAGPVDLLRIQDTPEDPLPSDSGAAQSPGAGAGSRQSPDL